jgi:NAD(P)-dependent dehydrogenase (short-subunit alcohol dehydrogenase family)
VPVALVTCGDRGPGRTIAEELADRDLDVLLAARDAATARRAAEQLWDEGLDTVRPRVLDPASPPTLAKLRDKIAHEFGALDVLVLCGLDEDERAVVRQALARVTCAGARVVVAGDDDVAAVLRELDGAA